MEFNPVEIITAVIDGEERTWTLGYGSWNKVTSSRNGNAYWQDGDRPLNAEYREEVVREATVCVESEGIYNYFEDRDRFIRFIEFYLRGKVTDTLAL